MSNLIEIKNIQKVYNQNKPNAVNALKGVNITIDRGEAIALMGVSGSGKSTLLHILGGMDSATSGEYTFDGKQIVGSSVDALADFRGNKVGFIFQQYGLLATETVKSNMELPLCFAKKKISKDEASAKINGILQSLSISELLNRKATELSGGQKQRVAIGRAIMNNPDMILADEPTGALDQKTAKEIMAILMKLVRDDNKTLIMATHDVNMTAGFDKIIYLEDGKIVDIKILRNKETATAK
ncbi:MAG: ABC transporter ATP-binding protein [Clostridia bacterium]